LVRQEDRIVVELHWRVAPVAVTFAMPMQLLWERARPLSLGNCEVLAMSPSDLILVLSVHGTRHSWTALEWITGIAELMRRADDICWEQVLREAEQFKVARAVRLGLALAHDLLEAPLPDQLIAWIGADAKIPGLIDWVASRLFVPIDSGARSEQWAAFKFELAVKDSSRDRMRDGLCRLFLPTGQDWAAARLPDSMFAIYHVLRPVRLLGRYLGMSREARQ
jgi:hypothetical protein